MEQRLTARHRSRIDARRRLDQLLQEEASLLAQYPDLRPDTKPRRTTPVEPRPDFHRSFDGLVKKYTVS